MIFLSGALWNMLAKTWIGVRIILDPNRARSSQFRFGGLVELGHLLHLPWGSSLATRIHQSQEDCPTNQERLQKQKSSQSNRGSGRVSESAVLFHVGNQYCSSSQQKQRRIPAEQLAATVQHIHTHQEHLHQWLSSSHLHPFHTAPGGHGIMVPSGTVDCHRASINRDPLRHWGIPSKSGRPELS